MASLKSKSVRKRPVEPRASQMALAVFSPTFLMAARPKRMSSPTGREVQAAFVHVWRKDADAHAARFVDVLHDFFCVARFGAEHRGHEFDWVVNFQIRGLVSEQRVGAGVGFRETVKAELFHQVENLGGFFRGNFPCGAACEEFFALRGHHVCFFLAHGAAQDVGIAQ